MMAFAFAANATEIAPNDPRSQELMKELYDVTQVEVNAFGAASAYGPALLASKDPNILEYTAFFRDMHQTKTTDFEDGKHDKASSDEIDFVNRFTNPQISSYSYRN